MPPKASLRPNDRPMCTSFAPPKTMHGPNLRRGAALQSHPTDLASGTLIHDLPDQGMSGRIQGVVDRSHEWPPTYSLYFEDRAVSYSEMKLGYAIIRSILVNTNETCHYET
jgi:hypothetical protein